VAASTIRRALRSRPSIPSRWIEDGSFTRLANITVGYTFNMPGFTGIARGSRVYLSGDNLHL